MKFSEYLSSFITPQMTLLEKFNALLKYLENHEYLDGKLYLHTIILTGNNVLSFIDTSSSEFHLEELNNEHFFDKRINVKVGINTVVSYSYDGYNSLNIIVGGVQVSFELDPSSMFIISQSVELYEN